MDAAVLGISLIVGAGLLALILRGRQEWHEDGGSDSREADRPLPPEKEDE